MAINNWPDETNEVSHYIYKDDTNIVDLMKDCHCDYGDEFCTCPEILPSIVMPII